MMKHTLFLGVLVSLFVTVPVMAQEVDCGLLLHDYQLYKNHNQLSEMASVVQQGVAAHCASIEYEVAKNHRNNNNMDKYVEYLNLAGTHGETAAKCDLLTLFEAGAITEAPAITREECNGQALGKTKDIVEEVYFEHPAWSDAERHRIWEENYNTSFSSFNDPFDYNKVDFDRIDKAWKNTKIGIVLMSVGFGVLFAGMGMSFGGMDNDPLFYSGLGVMGASCLLVITSAPFLASHNRLLRQGGVKFRTNGVYFTGNGFGVSYTQRFPYRPGYKVRGSHYVKLKEEGPKAMITPTFYKDFKGLSLVAVW